MIIIVDDEIDRIEPLLLALTDEGFVVKSFSDGLECLSFVRGSSATIELFIIDLIIPYGKKSVTVQYAGVELVKDLRRIIDKVPIVVLTSAFSPRIFAELRDLGVKEILQKPGILPSEIASIIKLYISGQ
jgi:CheY-like chemotaxis protein